MTNNSSVAGYLTPTSTAPSYDDAFDSFLQAIVVGIVGLDPTLCRPRWQSVIPKQPEPTVDWCAIGINTVTDSAARAQVMHDPNGTINSAGDGSDNETIWEQVTVLASMYGPNSWANIGFLNAGLRIAQNREAMILAGVGFVSTGTRRTMSEVTAQKVVVRRIDMEIVLNRVIARTYPIYNLISANGSIISELVTNAIKTP